MKNMRNKFVKIPKTFFNYSELRELNGDHLTLYCWLQDLLQLSKTDERYKKDGTPFVRFTEQHAEKLCNIKKGKLYRIKPLLKEVGLIDYKEQKEKKSGVALDIFVTEFEDWEKNKEYYLNKNKTEEVVESAHGFGAQLKDAR